MKRGVVGLAVVIAAALVLPARAFAIDHVVLYVSPAKLAAKPKALAEWKLSAAVVAAPSAVEREIFGVTLARSFMGGRAEELHAFRAAPFRSLSFDGQSGRWQARFGSILAVNMAIAVTGPAQPVAESQGCRGALLQVPVRLQGTLILRTGTKLFKTIRRARLAGSVTFNPGGAVDCTLPQPASCTPANSLTVTKPSATVLMSTESGGWMSLSFADRRAAAFDGATWYHVMRLSRLNPLSGGLPTITARLPSASPIQGSGTFTAAQTSTETRGACSTTSARGTFVGTFRTRFAGWGARTVRLTAADPAGYSESR